MSRKYKFRNKEGLYFVSFATVYWVDVFTRSSYCDILVDSLKYSAENLGLNLFCWCIMPNHVHLIFSDKNDQPAILLGRFKEFTSKQIVKAIIDNKKESRKEWMLWMFERAARKSSNVSKYQFWQHNNQPIELFNTKIMEQKADYLHDNPVKAGYVEEAWYWRYSSAIDYCDGKGMIDIKEL